MKGYRDDFYLEEAVSNNAFSFSQRHNPRLYVPSLIEGEFTDLWIGDKTVFEDLDEDGVLKSCTGLKNFIKTNWQSIPVYIVDNHNHVFYFWHHAAILGECASGLTLIHIDQHKDSRLPKKLLDPSASKNLAALFEYTNKVLNVGNFIPAALHTGIISKVINITSQKEMEYFQIAEDKRYIIDLDLDFFAPEMDYIKPENKTQFIKKLLPKANLITIATSPFFIDQKLAINYLLKIFS